MTSRLLPTSYITSCVYEVSPIKGLKPGDELMPPAKHGSASAGLLYADPIFDTEAMQQEILRFNPGSPTVKQGIQRLDLSKVGSTLAPKNIQK